MHVYNTVTRGAEAGGAQELTGCLSIENGEVSLKDIVSKNKVENNRRHLHLCTHTGECNHTCVHTQIHIYSPLEESPRRSLHSCKALSSTVVPGANSDVNLVTALEGRPVLDVLASSQALCFSDINAHS